eukprot:m.9732 g.9732  ORF g.9732 m.9732 type:complete len:326 (+) comp2448_c0_seq1:2-979(+)
MAQWRNVRLPPGWEVMPDPGTGRPVYVDHNTKTTSWDPPAVQPAPTQGGHSYGPSHGHGQPHGFVPAGGFQAQPHAHGQQHQYAHPPAPSQTVQQIFPVPQAGAHASSAHVPQHAAGGNAQQAYSAQAHPSQPAQQHFQQAAPGYSAQGHSVQYPGQQAYAQAAHGQQGHGAHYAAHPQAAQPSAGWAAAPADPSHHVRQQFAPQAHATQSHSHPQPAQPPTAAAAPASGPAPAPGPASGSSADPVARAALETHRRDADDLASRVYEQLQAAPDSRKTAMLEEAITRLLLKLDSVAVHGHDDLRRARKELVLYVEALSSKLQTAR